MTSGLRIVLCCFGVLLFGASSCEDQAKNDSSHEISTIENGFNAIVTTRFADDGCEVLLEIEENGEKVLLLPIQLDDQYKVNGLEVIISFHSSRVMQSNCQIGRPIVIEKIQFVG